MDDYFGASENDTCFTYQISRTKPYILVHPILHYDIRHLIDFNLHNMCY